MSGGSHEYLCYRDAEDLIGNVGGSVNLIDCMLSDLKDLGSKEAAKDTAKVIDVLQSIEIQMKELNHQLEQLYPVWRAVEWEQSCDIGRDELLEALSRYEESNPDKPESNQ